MTDYVLGIASQEQAARLEAVMQESRQSRAPVFDATDPSRRMLMFCFDGTGNDKDNPKFGNPSNVAHLFNATKTALSKTDSGDAFYFKGPGTGTAFNQIFDGAIGYSYSEKVNAAYKELNDYANTNPDKSITIGVIGFSRGSAESRAFMNKVWNEGVPDLKSKIDQGYDANGNARFAYTKYLVEPHKADLGLALLYDTVAFGAPRQDKLMQIAPAPGLRVYQQVAEDERRGAFALDSVIDPKNPNDPRIKQWVVAGAHSDNGGTYPNNGIGLKTLEVFHNILKNSGVPASELPPELKYNGQPLVIHDSFKGMYGPNTGPDTGGYVIEPRLENSRTYTNPDVKVKKPALPITSVIEERSSHTRPEGGYPMPDWSDLSKPIRVYNQEDGTSKLYTFNSDGVLLREKSLDVNGVDLTPKLTQSDSPSRDVSQLSQSIPFG